MFLKKSKIGTRLVLGFLLIAALVGVVSYLSHQEMSKVLNPLTVDIPRGLEELEKTSYLDNLAQKIREYDQILTESAGRYVRTGDRQYKYRHEEFARRLEGAIQEAIEKGDAEDTRLFSQVQQAKRLFIQIEKRAIAAVDGGDMAAGQTVLDGVEYWQSKREYKRSLDNYVEGRGKKHGEALVVTSGKVDEIVEATKALVRDSVNTVTTVSIFAVILAILLGFLVSRSILKPIQRLQTGAEIIGRGNLNHQIEVPEGDEIGALAEAFNDMTRKLKESYSGLEEKVREKTAELALKVQMIEEQNKSLEGAKIAQASLISKLEDTNAELEEEKAKDEAILASIGDGMIATDREGKIMMLNKQAEVLLGLRAADAVGRPYGEVIRSQDEKGGNIIPENQPLYQSLKASRKVVATAFYVRQDRTKFPVSVTVSPVVREGKSMGAIEIFRDITREKEVDRMKTEFISTVSHELRTPLTVIREGVSLVLDNVLGDTTEEQQNFLNVALNDIDRLGRIINNLLDVAKIEAGKVEIKRAPMDLLEVAQHVAGTFKARAQNKGLELRERYNAPRVELYGDHDKLIQVFTNLLGNAMKFTDSGFVEIAVKDEGDHIECSIKDTGRGISKEDLKKVFSKFQQFGRSHGAGEKGTGLGLSIAKGIVELHNGRIWVESQLGVGTRFVFTLPKYSAKDILREYLTHGLRDAVNQRSSLSALAFRVEGELPADVLPREAALDFLESAIKANMRGKVEQTVRENDTVYIILPGAPRTGAQEIADKIQESFGKVLAEKKAQEQTRMIFSMASYPEDASTEDEILDKLAA